MKNSLTFETFEKSCILLLVEKNLSEKSRALRFYESFFSGLVSRKIVKAPQVIKAVLLFYRIYQNVLPVNDNYQKIILNDIEKLAH